MKFLYFSTFIFLSFFSFSCFSLQAQAPIKSYDHEWKKVEELVKNNLPKSALTAVKNIYSLAKKEKQDAQIIKSLVYIIRLQSENRENDLILGIKEIEKEIISSKEPVTSLLKSFQAELYWNYFQQHRWQLYDRTNTTGFKKEDIATWTKDDFHKTISILFQQSLKNSRLLQQTKIEPFNALIIKGNSRQLRPTLFDLLAHKAIEYFRNNEREISKPAYAFEINTASAFAAAEEFINTKFITNDSLSLQHKALLLYQQLIAFHLKTKNTEAFLDADIARISFVNEYGVMPDKTFLFIKALKKITSTNAGNPAAAQAWFLLAQHYNNLAAGYSPYGDTSHRYEKLIAKQICENVLKQKKESEGFANCFNLLQEINKKQLSFEIEKVMLPEQPFRIFINYKNVDRVYLRIIEPDKKLKDLIQNNNDDTFWSILAKTNALTNWQQSLPLTNDFQHHSVEIKGDALKSGEYILLASTDPSFDTKKSELYSTSFYVSNISYVNNGLEYFLLHRETGQPLKNADIQLWKHQYDSKSGKYLQQKDQQYKSNSNGYAKLTQSNDKDPNRNYKIEIKWNNESLFINDWAYRPYRTNALDIEINQNDRKAFFFTDRSIYRPGQTVQFKAIYLMPDKLVKNKILSDFSSMIYLRDANSQLVDSFKVKTNEFGSVSGKFQIPQTVLTGQFTIHEKDYKGSVNIFVEEYKRPKFYVEYIPIEKTYKVNETIKITGNAKAYAGNNIDGALVKYRVVREPRFIYPWLFYRGWFPTVEKLEIAHGELKTDKDGKFVISFTAIPDLKLDKKTEPIFDYKVYADVTDINGETRSGETSVSVSYKSLVLKSIIPASLPADSLKSISIRTENMNGKFIASKVKVVIYKLVEEKRLIRKRYWQRPDQYLMTENEYINLFPNDEYDNETNPENWRKSEKVFESFDSTRENTSFSLKAKNFNPGWYIIEIETSDKNNEILKDIKYIQLTNDKLIHLTSVDYLWTQNSLPVEPGQTTSLKLGSSASDLYIIQQINKGDENIKQDVLEDFKGMDDKYSFLRLNNEIRTINFKATEADRGGYTVNYFFIKNNRLYQFSDEIKIPWTNKELQIEYSTFRDKTLPGSTEKWKLKITGSKNEKLAAEMLASMYDASLDQYKPHNWQLPSIWPTSSSYTSWNGSQNFNKEISRQTWKYNEPQKQFSKIYDHLNFAINNYYSPLSGGIYKGRELLEISMSSRNETFDKTFMPVEDLSIAAPKTSNDSENIPDSKIEKTDQIQIRKNFSETAFFFPELRTDKNGDIEFSFTLPEALTRWKFQALAHTKELAMGISSKEIITQKQLMVIPNSPRFLREGDRMGLSAKIVNLTEKEFTGIAQLQLFDADTNEDLDRIFQNIIPNQYFTVAAGQSELISFPIEIPFHFNKALTWRIIAKAENFSDGEEAIIPVLTNRTLVTETLPLNMKGIGEKNFSFNKLLQSGNSESLQHHSLTIEYTSNPAWYAVQALPYLIENKHENAEQVWNRYYANSIASIIANSSPRIKEIFEKWKSKDSSALLSNLQKNQELKSILLAETPWLVEGLNEEQQKKNIAMLFDLDHLSNDLKTSMEKLKQMQNPEGGFVWFKGGPNDRFITQYIVSGIGHLKKLQGNKLIADNNLKEILEKSIVFLDRKIKEDYDYLLKSKVNLKNQQLNQVQIQYLYLRGFFPEIEIPKTSHVAVAYYTQQSQQYWTNMNKSMQGMIALFLHRNKDSKTPLAILKSLKETSITHEELGMYWKDLNAGWFWHQAPIENHALMIEAFLEITNDTETVNDLKIWLLKNKQTNNWKTSKATAEACYALLLQGTDLLSSQPSVNIKTGDIYLSNSSENTEAGTGYFKKSFSGTIVKPEMGNISVAVKKPENKKTSTTNNIITWGAAYWQYFEDLDKITSSSTPLSLFKKLFVEKNTDRGQVLKPVNEGDVLNIGDKIKVRIELRVDRQMEYVHMKDLRSSNMEPTNVLSSYKWQGGLGYYESTKDASTDFFFSNLSKGTYVFEYSLFVTHKGNFSNGITTIQSMYAPEFTSHSEGIRITVE